MHFLPPAHQYSSVFFWHRYPKWCDWYFNDDLTPSLQELTQTNDSDQTLPSLKLVSLSASTELMLRSCSGLSTPLMIWVVKADAYLLYYHCSCCLLFTQCSCCLWGFTENTDPWPCEAPKLMLEECRRDVKQKPEVSGGVVFVKSVSMSLDKALRCIWLHKVNFGSFCWDRSWSNGRWPCLWQGCNWIIFKDPFQCKPFYDFSAQGKFIVMKSSFSSASSSLGRCAGVLCALTGNAGWHHPPSPLPTWWHGGGWPAWLAQAPCCAVWQYLNFQQSCAGGGLMGQRAAPRIILHIPETDSDIPASPEVNRYKLF